MVRTELVPDPDDDVARAVPVPGSEEFIDAGLVLSSVGYRGVPVPGVPFDPDTATIPNRRGRVLDATGGDEVPGLYTVGWIKRGPRGFIGSNKTCAAETVNALLDDANAGRLPSPGSAAQFEALLRDRRPDATDLVGWRGRTSFTGPSAHCAAEPHRHPADRSATYPRERGTPRPIRTDRELGGDRHHEPLTRWRRVRPALT